MQQLQPPTHCALTDRAKVIMSWLDSRLLPQLDSQARQSYHHCRRRTGVSAQGKARFFHGGPVSPVRMAVVGNGDEAHGRTRLTAIIDDVVVPGIVGGQITDEAGREIQQRLRGDFPQLWRRVDVALAQRERGMSTTHRSR